jgi:DNA-directed RNA polymerase specialized sigma subunit
MPIRSITPASRLEPKYQKPFQTWQDDPTPENATQLLTAVKPAIDRGIRAHVGAKVSPATRSHARRLTLNAVRNYDANKSQLTTHIINHMQGLKRVVRQQGHVLSVPERVELDRRRVATAQAELEDTLGREASPMELADHTRLSLRRLQHIQQFKPPVSEGKMLSPREEAEGFMPAVQQGPSEAWLEMVYQDLTPVDQNILDWTLGLHGRSVASNQHIAKRLRITPGAVSQRKAKIQALLDQREELEIF